MKWSIRRISPEANIPTPCALQASLQIFGRGMCTRIRARALILHSEVAYYGREESLVRSAGGFNRGSPKEKDNRTPVRVSYYLFGGADGNWTRVQRSIHTTFSVDSQSIRIPTSGRRVTGFHQGSFLMRDRYTSDSRFTCTTNLTHGLGRSPPKRYGRQY